MSSAASAPATLSALVTVTTQSADLVELQRELIAQLEKLSSDYEILYLLGAAVPHAAEVVRSLREAAPGRVRVLQFAPSVGEAAMLSAGVERARGDLLVTIPAYFETDLDALSSLVEAIAAGADLVFASRQRGRSGTSARLQSEIFNKLVSWAGGSRLHDVASGTRVFRRQVVAEIPLYGDFHRYLPMLAERSGFSVRELPADPHPRMHAPLVHAPRIYFRRAIDLLSVVFVSRFTRYPLRLFGGLGSLFAAVGLAILLVIGTQRVLGTPLADRPMLVLAILLVGLGVQAFTIGLLGELILFFRARGIRDYRITAIYEADPPALDGPASSGAPEQSAR